MYVAYCLLPITYGLLRLIVQGLAHQVQDCPRGCLHRLQHRSQRDSKYNKIAKYNKIQAIAK